MIKRLDVQLNWSLCAGFRRFLGKYGRSLGRVLISPLLTSTLQAGLSGEFAPISAPNNSS